MQRTTSIVIVLVGGLMAFARTVELLAQTAAVDRTKRESEQNEALRRAHDDELENSRRVVKDFTARVTVASELLGKLQTKANEFSQRMDSLLTDDKGKRLATDSSAFLHYIDLRNTPPVPNLELAAKKAFLDSLLKELNAELAQQNVGYVPPAQRKEETEQAIAWGTDHFRSLTEADGWLDSVIANAAEKDVSKAKTLRNVIDEYHAFLVKLATDARLGEIHKNEAEVVKIAADSTRAEFLTRAHAEANQSLQNALDEMTRKDADREVQRRQEKDAADQRIADLERKLAESIAARDKQKAATEGILLQSKKDAEMIRLRQKCHDPEVQRTLAPILAKGYWQPGDHDFEPRSLEATPVSLAKLSAAGALAQTRDGIHELYKIGVHTHGTLDRTVKWGFKQFEYMTPEETKQLTSAQKYLNELGEALVLEKMLEP